MAQNKNYYFHYAWRIVIIGFIMMALLHSMLQTCFSLFLEPVTQEMHISHTAFSGCNSIVALTSMLVASRFGRLMEHSRQLKKILMICVLGMGISYASYSLASSIIHMYVSAVFLGIFSCGATILPITIMLSKWFYKKRGIALGLTLSGSGIGGSLISPILSDFLSQYSWRSVFLLFGLLMILVEIPIIYFNIIPSPEDMGMTPYGYTDAEQQSSASRYPALAELKKQTFFYIYLVGIFSICICGYGSLGYLSVSLSENYNAALAQAIIPFFLLLLTPAKIFLGWGYDRWRTTAVTTAVTITYAIAFLILQIPDSEMLMWIMAVFFAAGISAGTVIPSVVTAELFGTDEIGSLFGLVYSVCMAAMAIGNPLIAAIHDLTDSYSLAWSACMTLCLLSCICIIYADISFKRFLKQNQDENT